MSPLVRGAGLQPLAKFFSAESIFVINCSSVNSDWEYFHFMYISLINYHNIVPRLLSLVALYHITLCCAMLKSEDDHQSEMFQVFGDVSCGHDHNQTGICIFWCKILRFGPEFYSSV